MSIEAINSVNQESDRWAAAQQAQQVALERRLQAGQEAAGPVGAQAANVADSASHSPIALAQAAQMQIYTQAGVLASMAASNAQVSDGHSRRDGIEIRAVDATTESGINKHA
jgi:hypothetical protein